MAYYPNYQRGYRREPDFERHPSGISFRWEGYPEEEHDEEIARAGAPGSNFVALHAAHDPHPNFPRFAAYEHKGDVSQDYRCLPLVEVCTAVQVQSTIAKTTLTQVYCNPSKSTIKEGTYTFPLYDGAAVVSFRCLIGEDKRLEGQIKPKAEAREVYNKALAEQHSAALLNELTPEIFEARLGNIPPQMSVKVDIVYVNELKADLGGQGIVLTIPTSIAPRYGSAPTNYSGSSINLATSGLKITVDVNAPVPIRTLESTSHPISVEMGTCGSSETTLSFSDLAFAQIASEHDLKRARATMADRNVSLGKDFVLLILAMGATLLQSQALLAPRLSGPREAAMMVALNPREILASQQAAEDFQGEIIFLVDRSGSMGGQKISKLRDALQLFLKSLPVDCYFNIGSFGSNFSSLWPSSVAYSQNSLDEAVKHVSPGSFESDMGGTEILTALQQTVKTRKTADCESTQIILLTDGEVWNTEETIQFVRETTEQSEGRVRFFALGIGDAVSHRLIEGIGHDGGGFGEVVVLDSQGRWDERVIRMLRGALMPSSWDCEVAFREGWPSDSRRSADVSLAHRPGYIRAPFKSPGLHPFARHSVFFLFGHEADPLPEEVTVKALAPGRHPVIITLPVTKMEGKTSTVHFLAAKSVMLDLEKGTSWFHSSPAVAQGLLEHHVKEEAERLGSTYGITSKWTSFVAVDQSNKSESETRSYKAKRFDLALLTKTRDPARSPYLPNFQPSSYSRSIKRSATMLSHSHDAVSQINIRTYSDHTMICNSTESLQSIRCSLPPLFSPDTCELNALGATARDESPPNLKYVKLQSLVAQQKADGSFRLEFSVRETLLSNLGGRCIPSLLHILWRTNELNSSSLGKRDDEIGGPFAPYGYRFYCPASDCKCSFGNSRLFKDHRASKHANEPKLNSSQCLLLVPQFREDEKSARWPEGSPASPKRRLIDKLSFKTANRDVIVDTFMSVWYIMKVFPKEKGTWELMLQKAKSWLNNKARVPDYHLREMDDVLEEFWKLNYARWNEKWDSEDSYSEDSDSEDQDTGGGVDAASATTA